jgi:hypothetical protein
VKEEKKQGQSGMRKEQAARTKLLSPWRPPFVDKESRVPMNVLRFAFDNGLLLPSNKTSEKAMELSCFDVKHDTLDCHKPLLFHLSESEPGKALAMLRGAIGDRRIEHGMTSLYDYMTSDATRIMAEMTMVLGETGSGTVEQLAWVPSQWKDQNMTPEALRTLGAPWLLSCEPAGARKDVTQWPLPGFGHCIIPQRGAMLVCLIPVESLIERGCEISSGIKFVTQLSWKDFEQFAATQLPFAKLELCHALWVPYGWRCMLIARSTSII